MQIAKIGISLRISVCADLAFLTVDDLSGIVPRVGLDVGFVVGYLLDHVGFLDRAIGGGGGIVRTGPEKK